MSSEPKKAAAGTVNVERRTWETDKYEQRAKDREEFGDEHVDGKVETVIRDKQEFRAAEPGAAGPSGSKRAWLKHRERSFNLESSAGQTRILTEPEVQKKATGWYCDVCECLLRDSASYLDHVNGKKHQRKLGFSMRVERVGVDSVRDRLAETTALRAQAAENAERRKTEIPAEVYEQRLAQRNRDEEDEWLAKRESKRARKEETHARAEKDSAAECDSEMNAMMGFGGFGASTKKKR